MNRKDLLAVLVFGAVILAFCLILGSVNTAGEGAETELVRDAVRSAAVTCYGVEGFYPASVEYLRQNYGLAYDEDQYAVFYDAFASNIMPTIRVVPKGESFR